MKKVLLCMIMLLPLVACTKQKNTTSIINKPIYYYDKKYIETIEYSITKGETLYFSFIESLFEKKLPDGLPIGEGKRKISFEGVNLDSVVIEDYGLNYSISCKEAFHDTVKITKAMVEYDNFILVSEYDFKINYLEHVNSQSIMPKYDGETIGNLYTSITRTGLDSSGYAPNTVWFKYGNYENKNVKFIINNITSLSSQNIIKKISYCFYKYDIYGNRTLIDEDMEYDNVSFPMELSFPDSERSYYAIKIDLEDTIDNDSFYTGTTFKFDLTINGDNIIDYDSIYYPRRMCR